MNSIILKKLQLRNAAYNHYIAVYLNIVDVFYLSEISSYKNCTLNSKLLESTNSQFA